MPLSNKELADIISVQNILESAPLIVWAVDLYGKFTIVQGKALEDLKYKSSDLVGKNIFDLFADSPKIISPIKRALAGEQFTADTPVKDRWFSSTYSPIYDQEKVVGVSAISVDITEKKNTEIKLAESESRFEVMANTAPVLVWIDDKHQSCTWVNQEWVSWTRRSIEQEAGNGRTKGIHPDDFDRYLKTYTDYFDNKREFRIEYRMLHKSGQYRWILDHGVPRYGLNAQFEGYIGACSDIQDVKDAENLPRQIIEAIPQGIWRTTPDGDADYFSSRFYELVNSSAEEFLGWGWTERIHPDDKDYVIKEWERCRKLREPVSIEFRVLGKDQTYRWYLTLGNPIFDQNGEIYKYYGTWTDIHEQKLSRELLQYQSDLTKTITDNATSCLFMMDKKGHPTFLNPAAIETTGYSLDEIKDSPLHYSIHFKKPDGSHYPMEECPIDNAHSKLTHVRNASEIFCRKDGSLFPVVYSVMPLEKNGEVIGSVLEFRDVTEQRNAEQSLREAINARDEFLSIASHELKTPLTTLVLQTQLQRKMIDKGDPKALSEERIRLLLDQSERLTGRLNRLIDDMLDISRIRAGRLNVLKEKADISKIVHDVIHRLSQSLINAGCGIPIVQTENYEGFWDVMRIEQVFANLLNNAMKYGKDKPIEINIKKKDDKIVIAIKDYGMGIADEDQLKVFKRFERAINANEISGLGLGLYISDQIVRAHGGQIWVESKLGQGSTFYFTLPL